MTFEVVFEVNYSGKEKFFSTKPEAIEFMNSLDVGSDLWVDFTLLRTHDRDRKGATYVTEYHPIDNN